ncbi:family 2 glycosyl transferase, partial [Streptomyces sp. SID9124]|nr:family 2 glycosyl transferase [Streptomyces sp. SID9124]
ISFGWRQPVAALIALAAGLAPVLAAAGWMIGGAAGPLERRDPVQVPAFVAEESGTRDQPRTLVLGGTSSASVDYTLVRGSGARLGDAELAAAQGGNSHLDKVVANLVAGSGADQGSQLSGFAIRYVLVRDGAPKQMSRVLDATPGLSRLSQLDGSALWRVDRQVARIMIVPSAAGDEPLPVGSQPVEAHTEIPAGGAGRVLRIADAADPGWQATLDGRALTAKTVDGWAQGFELPAEGGTLNLTYEAPFTHTVWIWAQVALAVVLVVMALPGRRREIDDDLPEEAEAVAAEPVAGEGRRARRLRAAALAEAEEAEAGEQDAEGRQEQGFREQEETGEQPAYAPSGDEPAYVPAQQGPETDPAPEGAPENDDSVFVPQQQYGEWDAQQGQYQDAGYQQYQDGPYQEGQYQAGQYAEGGQQPDAGAYDAYGYPQYQDGQYAGPYDPPAYDSQAYDQNGYGPEPGQYGEQRPYDPQNPENPAPGQNPWPTGNASRGESE